VVHTRRTCDGTPLERQRKGGLNLTFSSFTFKLYIFFTLFPSGRSCIRMGRKGIHGPDWINSSAQRNA
jgi:hypothetical protein